MGIVFCEDDTDVWYESTNRLNVESKQKLTYGVNTTKVKAEVSGRMFYQTRGFETLIP